MYPRLPPFLKWLASDVSLVWEPTPKIDSATRPFLKFDRVTTTFLIFAYNSPKLFAFDCPDQNQNCHDIEIDTAFVLFLFSLGGGGGGG